MRLFICFELSVRVRQQLSDVLNLIPRSEKGVSWSRLENIHLTLKFLGECDPTSSPQVKRALEPIAARSAPVNLEISRAGAFPDFKRPRVFWLGPDKTPGALQQLAGDIDLAMHKLGFAREARPYRPHLTLARVRFGSAEKTAQALKSLKFQPLKLRFQQLVLMQSQLQSGGPVYTPLVKCELASTVGGNRGTK